MSDVLADRFARVVDGRGDGDWLDVRRRARPSFALPLAVAAAALVVAAAAVASLADGWRLFAHGDGSVSGTAAVSLPDGRWTVRIDLRRVPPSVSAPHNGTVTLGGGGATYVLRDPRGRVAMTGTASSTFRYLHVGPSIVSRVLDFAVYARRGRAIAFGLASGDVASVRIVSGRASAAARTVKTNDLLRARLWVVAAPVHGNPVRIIALARGGKAIATVPVGIRGPTVSVAGATYRSRR